MKRGLAIALVAATAMLVGCGWTRNQKEGVKLALTQGFKTGLAKHKKTIDDKTVNAWATCVADKVTKRWKSFNQFKAHQRDPDVAKFRNDCADQTKLFAAVTDAK